MAPLNVQVGNQNMMFHFTHGTVNDGECVLSEIFRLLTFRNQEFSPSSHLLIFKKRGTKIYQDILSRLLFASFLYLSQNIYQSFHWENVIFTFKKRSTNYERTRVTDCLLSFCICFPDKFLREHFSWILLIRRTNWWINPHLMGSISVSKI